MFTYEKTLVCVCDFGYFLDDLYFVLKHNGVATGFEYICVGGGDSSKNYETLAKRQEEAEDHVKKMVDLFNKGNTDA